MVGLVFRIAKAVSTSARQFLWQPRLAALLADQAAKICGASVLCFWQLIVNTPTCLSV